MKCRAIPSAKTYFWTSLFLPIGMLAVTITEEGGLAVVGDVVIVVFAVVVVIDAAAVVESIVEGTGFAGTAGANGLSAIGLLLSTVGLIFTGANPISISISDPGATPVLVSLDDSLLAPLVDPGGLVPLLIAPVDPMLALDPAVDPVVIVVDSVVAGIAAGATSSFLSVDSSIELMTSGNLQQLPK